MQLFNQRLFLQGLGLTLDLIDCHKDCQVGIEHALDDVTEEFQDWIETCLHKCHISLVLVQLKVALSDEEIKGLEDALLIKIIVVKHVLILEKISKELGTLFEAFN